MKQNAEVDRGHDIQLAVLAVWAGLMIVLAVLFQRGAIALDLLLEIALPASAAACLILWSDLIIWVVNVVSGRTAQRRVEGDANRGPRMGRLAAWETFGIQAAITVVLVISVAGTELLAGLAAGERSVSREWSDAALLFVGADAVTGVGLGIAGLAVIVRTPGVPGRKRLAALGIVLFLAGLIGLFVLRCRYPFAPIQGG